MHPEIEDFIKQAIADGEVTEKERTIILKKAEKLGEDIDEVELILDGELAQMKKTNKEGELLKCPSCNATNPSSITKCSECGYKFESKEETSTIKHLKDQLKNAENEFYRKEPDAGILGSLKYLEKVIALEKNKANIISYFPIPSNKTEILKFLSYSISKAEIKNVFQIFIGADRNLYNITAKAWNIKCKEIVIKARFSMKDDKKALEKIEIYAKQLGIK